MARKAMTCSRSTFQSPISSNVVSRNEIALGAGCWSPIAVAFLAVVAANGTLGFSGHSFACQLSREQSSRSHVASCVAKTVTSAALICDCF